MIEIIREESLDDTKEKALPKDIKQVGKPDIGDRIYIENRVYKYLHPDEEISEKTAYVLLGKFENYSGRQCTFVKTAIALDEIEFEGELPVWNDTAWAYIYKQLKKEYKNMVIVGWALDHRGRFPVMSKRMEALHQAHFGGARQILFLMDTLESEDVFYSSRNGHLYQRDGFYIYYDNSVPACPKRAKKKKPDRVDAEPEEDFAEFLHETEQKEAESDKLKQTASDETHSEEAEPELEDRIKDFSRVRQQGDYRRRLEEKENESWVPSYSSTIALAAVICLLGVSAYRNHRQMNEMESVLAQMNQPQNVSAEESAQNTWTDAVNIENIAGNVKKQTQINEKDSQKQAEAAQQSENDAAAAENQTDSNPSETPEKKESGAAEQTAAAQQTVAENNPSAAESQTDSNPSEAPEKKESGSEEQTAENEAVQQSVAENTTPAAESQPTSNLSETSEKSNGGSIPSAAEPDKGGKEDGQEANPPKQDTPLAADSGNDGKVPEQTEAGTPETAETQSYLKQGYYIVKKGDSLASICRKIYQTAAMMDKVCEANGIEDPDAIFAGQYLTLPN